MRDKMLSVAAVVAIMSLCALVGRSGILPDPMDHAAIEAREADHLTGIVLASQPHWYFLGPGEASILPNGEGFKVYYDAPVDMELLDVLHGRSAQEFVGRRISFTYDPVANLLDFRFLD